MPRTGRSAVARSAIISALPRRERKALLAAATNYGVTPITTNPASSGPYSFIRNPKRNTAQDWQTSAWSYYDLIGEYRYACDWTGNVMARAVLQVVQDGKPVTSGPAFEALDALFGGPDGQSDMLRQIGRHWTVAGDCFIIGDGFDEKTAASTKPGAAKGKNAAQPDWLVAAATQVTQDTSGLWKVNTERFQSSALVIRIWRPHPTDRTVSDSPSRAVLPILSEIDGLTKYVAAQVDSRLAGNGILLVPNEMSFSSAAPEPAYDSPEDDDPPVPARRDAMELVRTLFEVSSAAIADREDPNSLIPIVLQADGEQLQYVRHLALSTDLQKQAIELRTEAVRRLALGMDMPPEILTGTSDMNHWSSWQIEEAAIKSHLEPLLEEVCGALTEGYLLPVLDGTPNAESFQIVADTSALRLRPNRSQEAIELYDRGELSSAALLRENGFDPIADAMPKPDLTNWLLKKIAAGSPAPAQVEAALQLLGVDLGVNVSATTPAAGPQPGAGSVADHPNQSPPDENGDSNSDPGADSATPDEQNQPGDSTGGGS